MTGPIPPSSPGDGQRYRFESRIATGGMGEVWRATDTVLGREVAVKVLKSEYAGDPTFRSRFETEARNAAALHHPNVASVFDFGELPVSDDGTTRAYLVMELVRGEPLSALLRGGERMPADTAADLLAQAADALAAAHDLGIVHRDVKPGNLLVTPDRTVKITDFGIARAANAAALTQTGQVVGTPQYLSPEQAEGKAATAASDIYSLGVVLYECLAGRRPFDADSPIATALAHLRQEPPALPDDVPAAMRETVLVALAKDPADRFATVRDFAAALRDPDRLSAAAGPVNGIGEAATRVQPAVPVDTPATVNLARDVAPESSRPRVVAPPPGPHDERPAGRRPARWLPWLAAAAVVLVLGVVLFNPLAGPGGGTAGDPGSASSTASSSGAATTSRSPSRSASPTRTGRVEVDEGDYLGRPRDEARQALEDLGLEVRELRVDNPGGEKPATVAGLSPSGIVEVGSTVTLSYYGEPATTQSPTTSPTGPTQSPSDSTGPDRTPSDKPSASKGPKNGASGSGNGEKGTKPR